MFQLCVDDSLHYLAEVFLDEAYCVPPNAFATMVGLLLECMVLVVLMSVLTVPSVLATMVLLVRGLLFFLEVIGVLTISAEATENNEHC